MTTFTYRSFNFSGSFVCTTEATIVTNGDTRYLPLSNIGTTAGNFRSAKIDASQLATSVSEARFAPENDDLLKEDIYIGTIDWGDNGEFTSTILLSGDFDDALGNFSGTYTLIVLSGHPVLNAETAALMDRTISNGRLPESTFSNSIRLDAANSLLSQTENDVMEGKAMTRLKRTLAMTVSQQAAVMTMSIWGRATITCELEVAQTD